MAVRIVTTKMERYKVTPVESAADFVAASRVTDSQLLISYIRYQSVAGNKNRTSSGAVRNLNLRRKIYLAALATPTTAVNAWGSRTAKSANTLRSSVTLAFFSPFIKRL